MFTLKYQIREDETNRVVADDCERPFESKQAAYTWIGEQNMHPWLHIHVLELTEQL